jgi:hypothetical protein
MGIAYLFAGTAKADRGKINLTTDIKQSQSDCSETRGISEPKTRKSGWYWHNAIPG